MNNKNLQLAHRLKIISGQIKGLEKMVNENKYCIDILTQSLAIQNALKEIDKFILENHLKTCVIDQIKGKEENKATEELIKIYSLSRKS